MAHPLWMPLKEEDRSRIVLRLLKLAAALETCEAGIIGLNIEPQYMELHSLYHGAAKVTTGAPKVTMEISGPSGITTLKFEGPI